ncbi:hypothetical protein VNO77_14620 [Canavalia gladiata]|uniref:Uncharacterized protein n=1 Tax=Canavalia gladiata TaxID=3824 RepID=A0AAN9M3M6_CANGL
MLCSEVAVYRLHEICFSLVDVLVNILQNQDVPFTSCQGQLVQPEVGFWAASRCTIPPLAVMTIFGIGCMRDKARARLYESIDCVHLVRLLFFGKRPHGSHAAWDPLLLRPDAGLVEPTTYTKPSGGNYAFLARPGSDGGAFDTDLSSTDAKILPEFRTVPLNWQPGVQE